MNHHSEQVLKALRKIIRAIELHSRKIQREIKLTGPQLLVLKEVGNLEEITIVELTRKTSLSQPTVSSLVKKLLDAKLILKKPSKKDKRAIKLQLSNKGRQLLLSAPKLLQDSFIKNFESLPEWQIFMILSSIEMLANMLNAKEISADPILSNQESVRA